MTARAQSAADAAYRAAITRAADYPPVRSRAA